MLHNSKSRCILQWFNALTTKADVQSLSQFTDGSLFCSIVTKLYSQIFEENSVPVFALDDCSIHLESSADTSTVDQSTLKTDKDGEISEKEVSTSARQNTKRETRNMQDLSNSFPDNKSSPTGNKSSIDVTKNYGIIKKFIDDFYSFDSSTLVMYKECEDGKDMELAKVAVLLLSAMVRNFLSSGDQSLQTVSLLENSVQEDIKDCLSLLMSSDGESSEVKMAGSLIRTEFHKVLGRASKSKATPRRKTPTRGTPEQADVSKRRRGRVSSIVYEDLQDSPLKGLLQSPNNSHHREAIDRYKNKVELSNLRNALHTEETKVVDLTLEKRNLTGELEKKTRELEQLKDNFRKYRELAEEVEIDKSNEKAKQFEEIERNNKLLKEKIDELKRENEALLDRNEELEEKLSKEEKLTPPEQSCDSAKLAEAELIIQSMTTSIDIRDNHIEDLKKKVKDLKQLYKESHISDRRHTPRSSPRVVETVSHIHYADAQEKELEIKSLKQDISSYKEKIRELEAAVQNLKEKEKKIVDLEQIMLSDREKIKRLEEAAVEYLEDREKIKRLEETKLQNAGNMASLMAQVTCLQRDKEKLEEVIVLYKSWQESLEQKMHGVQDCKVVARIDSDMQDCKVVARMDLDAHNNSGSLGKLWDIVPSDDVPQTRSRSTGRLYYNTSAVVEELKRQTRAFAKLLLRKNLISNVDMLKKIDAQTQNMVSVEDFIKSFDRVLRALKSSKFLRIATLSKPLAIQAGPVVGMPEEESSRRLPNMLLDFKQVEEKEKHSASANEEIEKCKLSLEEKEKQRKKFEIEYSNMKKMYESAYKCAQQFKSEKNKLLKMFLALQEEVKAKQNQSKVEPCEDCERFRKKLSGVKEDLRDSERKKEEIKFTVKDLENKIKSLNRQVKDLVNEKKILEEKIERKNAFLLGSTSARNSLIRRYHQQGLAESLWETRVEREATVVKEQPRPVVSVNTYILHPERKDSCSETSMSSHFANRSVRNVYLQTEDEEDFLNHSSLAQIQNGVPQDLESGNPEDRLRELQRRNTLCPPHLQSSYPLEVPNITSGERKHSVQPTYGKLFSSEAEKEFCRQQEEQHFGTSPAPVAVKKRKVSETDITQPMTSNRKMLRTSSINRAPTSVKTRTPTRQTNIIAKRKAFKTPSSIKRLMHMSRKNKLQ